MRRGFLLILLFILYQLPIFSQDKTYIQDPTLSVSFLFNDFKSAANVRATSLFGAIRDNQFGKIGEMSPGLGLNYIEGITRHYDVSITLAGSFLDYPFENRAQFNKDYFLVEGDISLRRKLFTNKYWVSPYVQLGVGASLYTGYYAAFIPAGAGLQVNFFDEAYLLLNAQYRIPVTPLSSYHFFYSVGLAGKIGRKKQNRTVEQIAMPVRSADSDRDGDGVRDAEDACPDTKGISVFKGCPDTDDDGVPDSEDKCPSVKGLQRYKGCEVPDTDGDGVNDEMDKCPQVKGVSRYQGCPVPDKDRDGIDDETDKCPDLPGVANSNGCPAIADSLKIKIDQAAGMIVFAKGGSGILKSSFVPLDNIVAILSANPNVLVVITGSESGNKVLSENRAKAVADYLVGKGIVSSRIKTLAGVKLQFVLHY